MQCFRMVSKHFLVPLFSGAYNWRLFCVLKVIQLNYLAGCMGTRRWERNSMYAAFLRENNNTKWKFMNFRMNIEILNDLRTSDLYLDRWLCSRIGWLIFGTDIQEFTLCPFIFHEKWKWPELLFGWQTFFSQYLSHNFFTTHPSLEIVLSLYKLLIDMYILQGFAPSVLKQPGTQVSD